ncbi:PIN domain-containing protein [Endothiovibrio diazotrophicus]
MGYLIDTSVWIEVERGRLHPQDVAKITGDQPVYVSPVTIAELKFGADRATDPDIRLRRIAGVERVTAKPTLPIDTTTGMLFGELSARLATGRGRHFRIQDLWLASQALQHGLTLMTHNHKDFADIPGLKLHILPASS